MKLKRGISKGMGAENICVERKRCQKKGETESGKHMVEKWMSFGGFESTTTNGCNWFCRCFASVWMRHQSNALINYSLIWLKGSEDGKCSWTVANGSPALHCFFMPYLADPYFFNHF